MNHSFLRITQVKPLDLSRVKSGCFITILNADRQPPHIALMLQAKIYSLTVKGRQMGDSFDLLNKTISKGSIKTLFFELDLSHHPDVEQIHQCLNKALMEHEKVEEGKVTCLAPVKRFVEFLFQINTAGIDFVFDLLPELEKASLIKACYQLNMEALLTDGDFLLKKYTMDTINGRIRNLK